ncbi:MAG: cytochrome c family protein [Rhodospirillaceae bacterium]|nr:cytochrome c family protein [Rhodospirillaceae bacterium]
MRKFDLSKVRAVFWTAIVAGLFFGGVGMTNSADAAFNVGAKKCQECHTEEAKVWEGTKHFKSFKTIHKDKRAKKIVKSIGDKRMKKSKTCNLCHYTGVQKKDGGKVKVASGPSCESCHGAASEWISVHNDYGKGVKREQESADHKAARIKNSEAAGMVRPEKLFDAASNCVTCHGLANPNLDPKHAAAMLDKGHPLKASWELVEYSQGSVRHRFGAANQETTDAEKSQMYIIGQAAVLVSATKAASNSDHPKYKAAQQERIANATAALGLIKGDVPEAAKLLSDPTVENGRALWEAIKGKDLTGAVGSKLPTTFK